MTPIIFDYWFHASSSSPLVKYQNYRQIQKEEVEQQQQDSSTESNDDNQKAEIYNSLHERNAPKILNVMLDLGGLYIKLGQVLSVTALPVPKQYKELFRTLQSNVPGHEEFEKVVRPTLEKELGCSSLDEIFEFIEEVPCGAASIGQAHRARLKKQFDTDDDDEEFTKCHCQSTVPFSFVANSCRYRMCWRFLKTMCVLWRRRWIFCKTIVWWIFQTVPFRIGLSTRTAEFRRSLRE